MDTSNEFIIVLEKQKQNIPVTYRDVAVTIANDEGTFLSFLSDNDFNQVYRLLHEGDSQLVVGKNASIIPDKQRVNGELHLLMDKKDNSAINKIISEFILNPNADNYTTNLDIISKLIDIGALKADQTGYKFMLQFA